MKEVIFKHLNRIESKKKDIFLREVFEKNGTVAKTERRCFYFIKDVTQLDEGKGLENWINSKGDGEPIAKRHFCILRGHSDRLGEDKLICKIAGTFYAVVDKKIYTIAFLHSFKASFMKHSPAK